jgi:SAM-dependent methyltransferase
MAERYDDISARHYAAYRPPLHGLILKRLVPAERSFRVGLDIGCGTGCSAIALARHCDRVIGLEPSQEMLARARSHPGVTYLHGSAFKLPRLPLGPVDVVSFAGSLFYTKTDVLRHDLPKVCARSAVVLVYDFEIRLDEILDRLGITPPGGSSGVSQYDHACDLSGWSGFDLEVRGTERIGFDPRPDELAHLLLSDSNRHDALAARFPEVDLFEVLKGILGEPSALRQIRADLFFSRWRIQ